MTTAAPSANGVPTDPRGAAGCYLDLGRVPIPVPYRQKNPVRTGWQNLRPTADDLDKLFPDAERSNIGLRR